MKILGLCLLFTLVTANAQQPSPIAAPVACKIEADNAALQQIIVDWKDGYNGGDAAKVAALYTDDAYYLTQHYVTGIVHGRAAIQAYVQRGVGAHYQIDGIQVITMECSGDSAYVITRYDATNAGQKAFGVNLVVLRRIGGHWLIVAHEAAVPDPVAAVQRLDTAPKR
jgi:uncharacterized protein (TIGR02246 family)